MTIIKEKKDQPRWTDKGLPDLRDVDESFKLEPPEEISGGDSEEEALDLLCQVLNLTDDQNTKIIMSEVGEITLEKNKLAHIVEKRRDARERYVNFAVETMQNPFEIWKVSYDNSSFRYAFIGLFKGRTQMLVIVSIQNGLLLWNFMQSNAKNLNKHRHGEVVYRKE